MCTGSSTGRVSKSLVLWTEQMQSFAFSEDDDHSFRIVFALLHGSLALSPSVFPLIVPLQSIETKAA